MDPVPPPPGSFAGLRGLWSCLYSALSPAPPEKRTHRVRALSPAGSWEASQAAGRGRQGSCGVLCPQGVSPLLREGSLRAHIGLLNAPLTVMAIYPLRPRDLFAHPPCRGGDGDRRPVLQDSGCRLCCRGPQLSLLAARGGPGAPGEAHVPATLPSWAPSGCTFQPLPERPRWLVFPAAVLPALCASPALSPWPAACEAVGLVCTPRMYPQVGSGHRQGVHREGRRHTRQPVRSAAFVDGAHGACRRASVLEGQ